MGIVRRFSGLSFQLFEVYTLLTFTGSLGHHLISTMNPGGAF